MLPRNALVFIAVAITAAAPAVFAQVQPATPASTQPAATAALVIPPDNERAADALAKSPRHGEWVDISAADGEYSIKTWVVYPERSDKAPVVLVIHEIFGLTDWVRGVADQLAADGFIALAPDMLSGMGPQGGGTDELGDKARETIRKLTPAEQAVRLDFVRDYALTLPAFNGKVGCIGFCWGGSAAFNYAARQPSLNAAVVYYGTAPMADGKPDAEALGRIACPILGCYGGDDARVTSTVDATHAALKELGKSFTPHVYADAGHGFLRQSDASQREGANLRAAQAAWGATLEFLRANTQ